MKSCRSTWWWLFLTVFTVFILRTLADIECFDCSDNANFGCSTCNSFGSTSSSSCGQQCTSCSTSPMPRCSASANCIKVTTYYTSGLVTVTRTCREGPGLVVDQYNGCQTDKPPSTSTVGANATLPGVNSFTSCTCTSNLCNAGTSFQYCGRHGITLLASVVSIILVSAALIGR